MIQLIVSDIDSTLLGPQGELPPENVATLRAAGQRGVRWALATIRKRDATLLIADQIGIPSALICNGGATIFDAHGRELCSLVIPLGLARDIAGLADHHQLPAMMTVDEVNYYLPNSHPAAHISTGGIDVERLAAVLERAPSRFIVRGEPGASIVMRAFERAPLRFVRHFRSDGALGDVTITHADATKESALAFLCRHWSIAPADVLAIGDAEADLGMLQMAGVGVAIGNAQPSVRAAADWVAPDASLGGVAAAIRRFVLGGLGEG
jgi:hydroxymethylpyrimidine pyrophosphatase-like HAD family hydrolase